MRQLTSLIFATALAAAPFATQAGAGNDAVVGSIIGGATGAIIGNGFGGRDGAIVGGAIGAAAGVAIATDNNRYNRYNRYERYDHRGYDSRRDHDYGHDDRRYRDDDRRYQRNIVVVESPRYYYRGNDFVYGRPSDDYRGHGRGRGHGHHHHDHEDCGPDVVVIERNYRRW